jgi:hypothetical protein
MESYELRTVYQKVTYHQHCFLMLLREKNNGEKAQRAESELAVTRRRLPA